MTVLFGGFDNKTYKNKSIGLVLQTWGSQSADIEDPYAIPKLQGRRVSLLP
jgi:hypothetical protein